MAVLLGAVRLLKQIETLKHLSPRRAVRCFWGFRTFITYVLQIFSLPYIYSLWLSVDTSMNIFSRRTEPALGMFENNAIMQRGSTATACLAQH